MSLADAFNEIGAAFSAALGGPFHSARVVDQAPLTYDDGGSITGGGGPVYRTCSVQVDAASQRMREAEGYVDTDVSIIILAASLTGALTTEAQIEILDGPHVGTWMVALIERDPVAAGWAGRGRRG